MILSGWDNYSPQKQNNRAQIFIKKTYKNQPYRQKQNLRQTTVSLSNSINMFKISKDYYPNLRKKKINSNISTQKSSIQRISIKNKNKKSIQNQIKRQPLRQWASQNIDQRASSHIQKLKKQVQFLQEDQKQQSFRINTYQCSQIKRPSIQTSPLPLCLNDKKISSLKNPRRIVKGRPQMAIAGKKSIISCYKDKRPNLKRKPKNIILLTQLSQKDSGCLITQLLAKWHNKNQQFHKKKQKSNKNNPTLILKKNLATIC